MRFRDVPHTRDMRMTERFRLVAPDILWDEITIEDPAVLEKPWTVTFAYRRMPDYEIIEYVCEDNREYADEDGVTSAAARQPTVGPRPPSQNETDPFSVAIVYARRLGGTRRLHCHGGGTISVGGAAKPGGVPFATTA